jgi:hypothetical protein
MHILAKKMTKEHSPRLRCGRCGQLIQTGQWYYKQRHCHLHEKCPARRGKKAPSGEDRGVPTS